MSALASKTSFFYTYIKRILGHIRPFKFRVFKPSRCLALCKQALREFVRIPLAFLPPLSPLSLPTLPPSHTLAFQFCFSWFSQPSKYFFEPFEQSRIKQTFFSNPGNSDARLRPGYFLTNFPETEKIRKDPKPVN